jgi:hypothetical protein
MPTPKSECKKCKGSGNVQCPRCNGTGKEPESTFHTESFTTWKKIRDYIDKNLQGKSWIFRGKGNATRRLKTSLERACEDFPEDHYLKDPRDAEILLLREFRRRFHHYLRYTPREDDCLEWLSLMQHYGAPTRLLDFTYSFYVAAFFALEKKKDDYAIWAVRSTWAVEESRNKFDKCGEEYRYLEELIN